MVVETEDVLELDLGPAISGGNTKMMKRAPIKSTAISDATNDTVLSPRALFLLNESKGNLFYFSAFLVVAPSDRALAEVTRSSAGT